MAGGAASLEFTSTSNFPHILSLLTGLLMPSLVAWLLLSLIHTSGGARYFWIAIGLVLIISLIFWVRGFGFVIVPILAAACFLIVFFIPSKTCLFFAQLLIVQFGLSVFRTIDYAFTGTFIDASGKSAESDVLQLAKNTFGDVGSWGYIFWGIVVSALSIIFTLLGLRSVVKRAKK